jgi:4-carboxymuconolactone decarboxylase
MKRVILLVVCASVIAPFARAQERLPVIPPAKYTQEQKRAAEEFEAARHTPVFGPFEPMMYSPQLMSAARSIGDYLRYKSVLGNTLSELAILMTARAWSQDYEWSAHYSVALKAGIRQDIVDAIAADRRPASMGADEEIVFEFVSELLKTKLVSDRTFDRARSRFGPRGAVDLTGIVGYYSLLAMQLNAARYPLPKDATGLPKPAR